MSDEALKIAYFSECDEFPERILRREYVERMTGFCSRHLLDMEAKGNFPRRFRPDPEAKIVGWLQSEILAWIKSRSENRELGGSFPRKHK